jgi:hypothetical protein
MITKLELTFNIKWWEISKEDQIRYLGWARAEWEPIPEKKEDKFGVFEFLSTTGSPSGPVSSSSGNFLKRG